MGDMGEDFRAMRDANRALRNKYGVGCPECIRLFPKASPKILLPGQQCKRHRYRDPRPRLTEQQRDEAINAT